MNVDQLNSPERTWARIQGRAQNTADKRTTDQPQDQEASMDVDQLNSSGRNWAGTRWRTQNTADKRTEMAVEHGNNAAPFWDASH